MEKNDDVESTLSDHFMDPPAPKQKLPLTLRVVFLYSVLCAIMSPFWMVVYKYADEIVALVIAIAFSGAGIFVIMIINEYKHKSHE